MDGKKWPRLVACTAGAALAAWGLRQRGARGLALAGAGAVLLARGLGPRSGRRLATGRAQDHMVTVHKTLRVAVPPEAAFAFWAWPDRLPRFLGGLREVRDLGAGRWQWRVKGPMGLPVSWEVESALRLPARLFSWRSAPGAPVRHHGEIAFEPLPGGHTRIDIALSYDPPPAPLGEMTARLFGADPRSAMDAALLAMKAELEHRAGAEAPEGAPPQD